VDLSLQRVDLVLIGLELFCCLLSVGVLVHLDIVVQSFDVSFQVISTFLLNQNFLRQLDGWQLGGVLLFRFLINDRVDSDHTVLTD